MITIANTNRINKFALLANAASVGGMMLLLASVLLPLFVPATAAYSLVTMIVGGAVAMIGIYYANRWVRKPRPEEQIQKALKGLGDGYVLFHYPRLPIDHLLLTPGGVVVIETVSYAGAFSYREGKWKEGMTMGRAIRYIVEPHLGKPDEMARAEAEMLRTRLEAEGLEKVPVKPVVYFSHPGAHLDVKNPPVPVARHDKLRKHADLAGAKLSPAVYEKVKNYLESLVV